MPWTDPATATTLADYLPAGYNADADNLEYVVRPLAVLADTVTIDDTNNENDLLTTDPAGSDPTKRVVLPGGWLGTAGMLRGTVMGDHLNLRGTGTTASLQFRLKLGGVTVFDDTTDRFASDTHHHNWQIKFFIANLAADSQFATGYINWVESETATIGLGGLETVTPSISGPAEMPFGSDGLAAVDTTIDQPVQLTIQHQFAGAMTTRMFWACVELIGQTA